MLLLLASPVGCGGDDGNGNDNEEQPRPVAGTFVGKVRGSEGLVAVVAAPPMKGQDRREVSALVCDAGKTCALFSGGASGNSVVVKSGDGKAETEVKLNGNAATGSVKLPEGETQRYSAPEATATSGLYDLTVSREGKVTGASAAGVGLTGQVELPPPGTGRLKLADGTKIKLEVTKGTAAADARLRPGQLRLIVLPDGEVRGVGKARGEGGGGAFFVTSKPK
jgi:hypothetical protein